MRNLVTRLLPIFALVLAAGGMGASPILAQPYVERQIVLDLPDSWDVAVADFNGDGLSDVAALNSFGPFITECTNPPPAPIACGPRMLVSVALNQGLGHLAPGPPMNAMCLPWTLAAGRFDGDAFADLVIGNRGARDAFGVCSSASLSFLPGDGQGGFGTAHHLAVPNEPMDIATVDLDGDGTLEFVVAFGNILQPSLGMVQVFKIGPGGSFLAGQSVLLGSRIASLATGDLEGDGDPDLVATLTGPDGLALFDFAGDVPVLREICSSPGSVAAPRGVVIADLIPDGRPEITVINAIAQPSYLTVFQRDPGTGSYCDSWQTSELPGRGEQVAAADLDADGFLDLAVTDNQSRVFSLPGDGTGVFPAAFTSTTGGLPGQLVAADLDRIGGLDLAIAGGQRVSPGSGMISEMLNAAPIADGLILDLTPLAASWIGVRDAITYDVVSGSLSALNGTGGNYSVALQACLADDQPGTSVALTGPLAIGTGTWVLARPNFSDGPGSYDSGEPGQVGSRDPGIAASPLACP